MSACPEYDRLAAAVDQVLKEVSDKTSLQLELFRSRQHGRFMQTDKELELLIGKKERTLGAFRQHASEHGCQQFRDERKVG